MPREQETQYKYIDLFSGCGGLALGMHQAGWKALFAGEKNEDAFETLNSNLIQKNDHFCWPDWLPKTVHDIDELIVLYKDDLKKLSGSITLVAGGPPCQGFSTAGRRDESDARNSLVDSYLSFIDLVEPESILFENVKGFTQAFKSKNKKEIGKKYSEYIIAELETRGYKVGYQMLNFSQFGVPQRRIRFVLYASKKYNPDKLFTLLNSNVESYLEQKKLPKYVSIRDALSDLEAAHGQGVCPDSKRFKAGKYGSPQNNYQRYCRAGARKGNIPDSHRFANHKEETIKRFKELQQMNMRNCNISRLLMEKYKVNKNCFSVLDENLPAPTLTSNPDDHIHYCEPRTLTVREYARIQSFPDWYEFKGKYTTGGDHRKIDVPRYTQIGNAIPPMFAEQVGIAIQQLMDGSE